MMKECPFCKQLVETSLTACSHCGKVFNGEEQTISSLSGKNVLLIVAFALAGVFLLTTIAAGILFYKTSMKNNNLLDCTSNLKQIGIEYSMALLDGKLSSPSFKNNPVKSLLEDGTIDSSFLHCKGDANKKSDQNYSSYITFSAPSNPADVIAMDKPGNHEGYCCMLLANGATIIFPCFETKAETILRLYYDGMLSEPLTVQRQQHIAIAAEWDKNNQ